MVGRQCRFSARYTFVLLHNYGQTASLEVAKLDSFDKLDKLALNIVRTGTVTTGGTSVDRRCSCAGKAVRGLDICIPRDKVLDMERV